MGRRRHTAASCTATSSRRTCASSGRRGEHAFLYGLRAREELGAMSQMTRTGAILGRSTMQRRTLEETQVDARTMSTHRVSSVSRADGPDPVPARDQRSKDPGAPAGAGTSLTSIVPDLPRRCDGRRASDVQRPGWKVPVGRDLPGRFSAPSARAGSTRRPHTITITDRPSERPHASCPRCVRHRCRLSCSVEDRRARGAVRRSTRGHGPAARGAIRS